MGGGCRGGVAPGPDRALPLAGQSACSNSRWAGKRQPRPERSLEPAGQSARGRARPQPISARPSCQPANQKPHTMGTRVTRRASPRSQGVPGSPVLGCSPTDQVTPWAKRGPWKEVKGPPKKSPRVSPAPQIQWGTQGDTGDTPQSPTPVTGQQNLASGQGGSWRIPCMGFKCLFGCCHSDPYRSRGSPPESVGGRDCALPLPHKAGAGLGHSQILI